MQNRLLILSISTLACAPVSKNVIEPDNTIEPDQPTDTPSAGDRDFILSRDPRKETTRPGIYPVHIKEEWFPFRAKFLGLSKEDCAARDAKIGNQRPPSRFWDEQTAIEAVSVWTEFCNECHGGRRSAKDALKMPQPPGGWGAGEGLFFGKKKEYTKVFDTIINGGPPPKDDAMVEMPSWKGKLSKEMIWALIFFLEFQSGGIEGRFPPSLFPRTPDVVKD